MPDDPVFYGVAITHSDRVLSAAGPATRGDLAAYYAAAVPLILPRIAGRPLTLLRCPDGIDGGACFYQRNAGKGLGAHVKPFRFRYKGTTHDYLYIEDERGLMELVRTGTVEIHAWGARVDSIGRPDRLVFDLDPAPGVPFAAVRRAAMEVRERLKAAHMEAGVKCTGGKGLHVTVDLDGTRDWAAVKSFARSVAVAMAADAPGTYVATMSKARRAGRIFIDYLRNDCTATSIADYAVRARPGLPVAMPLEWDELKTLKSADRFTVGSPALRDRLRKTAGRRGP